MLCDVCQKRQAKIFYTEIVNGKKTEQHLCEQCASEHTVFPIGNIGNLGNVGAGQVPIGNILSGILNHYMNGKEEAFSESEEIAVDEPEKPVCKQCGMTETEVLKYGRLGCPVCYSTFADIISKNVKATQGGTLHCGKEPHCAKMVAVDDMAAPKMAEEEIEKKPVKKSRKRKNEEAENKISISDVTDYEEKDGAELIEQLKKDLKEALAIEDYKEAAHLRDTIRYFEGKENEKKEK